MDAELAYLFRHALLRDAAYQLQLPGERAALHALTLAVVETVFAADPAPVAMELADHARKAGEAFAARELELLQLALPWLKARLRFQDALRCAERLAVHELADGPTRLKARCAVVSTLSDQGSILQAELLADALLRDPEGHNPELRAQCMLEASRVFIRRSRSAEAIDLLQRAEALATGDLKLRAEAQMRLGASCHELGQPEQAFHWLSLARASARACGDTQGEWHARRALAQFAFASGHENEGISELQAEVDWARAQGNLRAMAHAQNHLGWQHLSGGRKHDAEPVWLEGAACMRRVGDRRGEAGMLHALGTLYWGKGELAVAERCFQDSLSLSQEIGDAPMWGITCSNLGWLLILGGRHDESRELLTSAEQVARKAGFKANLAHALCGRGWWELENGRFDEAAASFQEALECAQAVKARNLLVDCHCWRSRLQLLLGEVAQAAHELGQAEASLTPAASRSWHGAAVYSMRVRVACQRAADAMVAGQDYAGHFAAAKAQLASMDATFPPSDFAGSWELAQVQSCAHLVQELVAAESDSRAPVFTGGHLLSELSAKARPALAEWLKLHAPERWKEIGKRQPGVAAALGARLA